MNAKGINPCLTPDQIPDRATERKRQTEIAGVRAWFAARRQELPRSLWRLPASVHLTGARGRADHLRCRSGAADRFCRTEVDPDSQALPPHQSEGCLRASNLTAWPKALCCETSPLLPKVSEHGERCHVWVRLSAPDITVDEEARGDRRGWRHTGPPWWNRDCWL
jgi:hypothetical protein